MTSDGKKIAPMIDHTLLKSDAGEDQVIALCREAMHYGFAAVCVTPFRLALAVQCLSDSPVNAATVIGFPLGASTTRCKAFEARQAIKLGADELDMVLSIGALKDKDYDFVENDIRAVVAAAAGRTVKVILETSLLTDFEKRTACKLAVNAQAHFVKTSTGFAGPATEADVRLMRKAVGERAGVKASGGIRSRRHALAMIQAGASRIGTSAGVAIVSSA